MESTPRMQMFGKLCGLQIQDNLYIYISTSSAVPHKLVQISLRNMYRVQLSATVSSVCINMYNLANFI